MRRAGSCRVDPFRFYVAILTTWAFNARAQAQVSGGCAMNAGGQPVVYISYTWINVVGPDGRPARAPDPRARELADWLRENRIDVRLDTYFGDSLYGFKPPERVKDDPRDPWLVWAARQIAEADAVLLFCTEEYWRSRNIRTGSWSNWCRLDEGFRIAHQEDDRVP